MKLTEYYKQLEKAGEKFDFARKVVDRTGVSLNAVRNWCKGYNKTTNEKYLNVLSEITNIPKEELF